MNVKRRAKNVKKGLMNVKKMAMNVDALHHGRPLHQLPARRAAATEGHQCFKDEEQKRAINALNASKRGP